MFDMEYSRFPFADGANDVRLSRCCFAANPWEAGEDRRRAVRGDGRRERSDGRADDCGEVNFLSKNRGLVILYKEGRYPVLRWRVGVTRTRPGRGAGHEPKTQDASAGLQAQFGYFLRPSARTVVAFAGPNKILL